MKKFKNILNNEIILSIIFAVWIFIVLLISESLFLFYEYKNLKIQTQNNLISKSKTLKTIIKNSQVYINKKNDYTLYQIVKKWLENTLIIKNSEILSNYFPIEIDKNILEEFDKLKINDFKTFWNYIIYKDNYKNDINLYLIKENNYNDNYFLKNILLFIIIDIILFIFSAFISFVFIKKILSKLEQNIQYLKEFTNDINHELKTPLSIIKSSLELYKFQNWNNEYVIDALNATNNINLSLDSISELSLHIEHFNEKKEYVFIKNEIKKLIKIYKNEITNKNIFVIINIDSQKKFNIYKNNLLICISNILKNAIKYSKNNWNIIISWNKNYISITDNWIWIPKENINKIFHRYYSLEKKHWKWIWLSIIQKIIDKNWRKIEVHSKKWEKTTFK